MKKPTFTARLRNGETLEIAYHPLIVIAGTETHRLALHKNPQGLWAVSHPESGALVVRCVTDQFKGCPVQQRPRVPVKEAYRLALDDVEWLIRRIGSEKFNAGLANPKPF